MIRYRSQKTFYETIIVEFMTFYEAVIIATEMFLLKKNILMVNFLTKLKIRKMGI